MNIRRAKFSDINRLLEIYKKAREIISNSPTNKGPTCNSLMLLSIFCGILATILDIKITREPPTPNKEFRSDNQTKKKVPAIKSKTFKVNTNP